MEQFPLLVVVAAACLAASGVWGRSALRLERAYRRLERQEGVGHGAVAIVRVAFRKDATFAALMWLLGVATGAASLGQRFRPALALALIPAGVTFWYARQFLGQASLLEQRVKLERRAEEVLAQETLAPVRWSARLAPDELPSMSGFEVGSVYEPGAGSMAGDFYDIYPIGDTRLAAVIGDVAGHGIEPSITAFQVKYLLRVFLRQYRDPAQAIEELNTVLSATGRPEDLVSLCAVVFDQAAGTLRFASAGHPPAWVWHDGEVRPLRATGPLLTLDPKGSYYSREVPLSSGDVLLLYTDGLTEARAGEQLFGEERVAQFLRRDPGEELNAL
ncbi:MAG: serine/threonine-protein phosphatase, partial [Actinobacteria bacterium]|nr:serine/threonine-protein phosphatase [Actinomycetota bacterium]